MSVQPDELLLSIVSSVSLRTSQQMREVERIKYSNSCQAVTVVTAPNTVARAANPTTENAGRPTRRPVLVLLLLAGGSVQLRSLRNDKVLEIFASRCGGEEREDEGG